MKDWPLVHLLRIVPRDEPERVSFCGCNLGHGSLTTVNRNAATCAVCLRALSLEERAREVNAG